MARSSENAFFANFSASDAPFPTKVRLALANSWKNVRTRYDCCGNYGEPGCGRPAEGPREGPNDHGHPHQHGEHG